MYRRRFHQLRRTAQERRSHALLKQQRAHFERERALMQARLHVR